MKLWQYCVYVLIRNAMIQYVTGNSLIYLDGQGGVMMLFEKKVTIFKKKDRETWQKIKDTLKAEGVKGVRASHYFTDALCACGCGSKLDPRDFGVKGKIDRDIYFVDVRKDDLEKATAILQANGVEVVVEDDAV